MRNEARTMAHDRAPAQDAAPADDTAARSLAHWSEQRRAEMDAFYVLADEDYRQLALAADWAELLGERAAPGWKVLDVACGSGRFPRALRRYGGVADADLPALTVDLLDPSAFSVDEAAGHLAAPFVPGRRLVVTLQDLPPDATAYDVVWATHALYALPPADLDTGAERMVGALAPGGLGFVAHATAASHYLRFYDAYREGVRPATPYLDAAQVADALSGAGSTVRTDTVRYQVSSADPAAVEGFLQRCAFDDTVSLDDMRAAPVVGPYLEGCVDGAGTWTFDQEVALIWFGAR
jgi:SAM-dependent methyltransferase